LTTPLPYGSSRRALGASCEIVSGREAVDLLDVRDAGIILFIVLLYVGVLLVLKATQRDPGH
jgi:hypothetical protein